MSGALQILETCLYVDDLDAAERFYTVVLGLPLVERQDDRHVFFRCGRSMLLLFSANATASTTTVPPHGAQGPGHVAFAVKEDDLGDWRKRLERCKVDIEQVIEWPQGGCSIYFRDPAGNSLEIASVRIWGLPDEDGSASPSQPASSGKPI